MNYDEFIARKLTRDPPTGLAGVPALASHLFPHQRDLTAWGLRRGRCAVFADTGLGKAQPVDEPVLTPSGWRPIGDLRVGDHVIAGDGTTTLVTGVYPQGEREIVQVAFNDGATTRCDWEHLWTVRTDMDGSRGRPWRTMTTRELVARGLLAPSSPTPRLRWQTPVVGAVDTPEVALPVDPYVLGVLLGDGSFKSSTSVTFTSADPEIVAAVGDRLSDGLRVVRVKDTTPRTPSYRISLQSAGSGRPSPLIDALRAMQLWGHYSHEKWIPEPYFFGSIGQRGDLLRGLIDTDGYVAKDGTIQFGSSSRRLADGVLALVRSLGGVGRLTSKVPTFCHRGERREGLRCWTVTIALPNDVQPCTLARKLTRHRERSKYHPSRKIESVTAAGMAQAVCISVAHPSRLYVTRDYVVTHNTLIELEWARHVASHTSKPVLLLAPLAVGTQTAAEGSRFGVPATLCRDGADVRPGVNITNYERLHRFDASVFGGVVLDESSCIKHHDAKTFGLLCAAFANTPFRLCATATPAPNDWTELGTHAEFLGVCSRSEMLAEYFTHDGGDTSVWRLKGHARGLFWRWVASWAALVRRPSDLGHDDSGYELPPLEVEQHTLAADQTSVFRSGMLFAGEAQSLSERRAARKGSLDGRVAECVERVNSEPGERWIVWCELNAEQDALAKAFGEDCYSVFGSLDADEKERRLTAFAAGDRRVLVTKPSIAGWGLNLQSIARMAFVGVTDSWESYYQSVRRCYRFGQKRAVQVHLYASELEGAVVANLARKERDARAMSDALSVETRDAVRAEVLGTIRSTNDYQPTVRMVVPSWLKSEGMAA